jgi:hypothetical protein
LADGEGAMKVWLSGLAKSSHKFVFETAGRVLDLLDPLGILWRRLEAGLGLAKLLAAPAEVFSWHLLTLAICGQSAAALPW